MELDGLYRALLYEKTLDKGTVQSLQIQLHQVLLPSVSSLPFLLRFQGKVVQSHAMHHGDFARADYLDTMNCAAAPYIAILQQCTYMYTYNDSL